MTSELAVLPIVDLKRARDPTQRLAVAKQLVHALETVGFLFVDNVEGFDCNQLMNTARWYFNLSDAQKRDVTRKKWNPQGRNSYRGAFPLQTGGVCYKEGFEIGWEIPQSDGNDGTHPLFLEGNIWPTGMEGAEQFRADLRQYNRAVMDAGDEILRLVCLACGLDENWFQSMFFPDSVSTLRLQHYPPRPDTPPQSARDGDWIICCEEHCDSGFVTLLATFDYLGLQIEREEGQWVSVPPRPQSLTMNIGDMLSIMSGGRFKSTKHRVVDMGVERFSVPFFMEPRYTADITRLMPCMHVQNDVSAETVTAAEKTSRDGAPCQRCEENKTRSRSGKPGCERYGAYLIEKMRNFVEYMDIVDQVTA